MVIGFAVTLGFLAGCESELGGLPPSPRGSTRALASPTVTGTAESEVLGPSAHPLVVTDLPRNKDDTVHVHSVLDTITTTQPATAPASQPSPPATLPRGTIDLAPTGTRPGVNGEGP